MLRRYFLLLIFVNLLTFPELIMFFTFSSFSFLPSKSALMTLSLFSSGSKANLENFFGLTNPSLSVISLNAGTRPRLIKHPSISFIEFISGRAWASFSSRSKQNEESFSHILREWAFAMRRPLRVLQGRKGEPISQRHTFSVLLSETMLYSAVPVIRTTDFGDSGKPCKEASCIDIPDIRCKSTLKNTWNQSQIFLCNIDLRYEFQVKSRITESRPLYE